MWDAYTTTDRFPYSQPRGDGVNYIRNSVKVVIDAYDGSVTFYQIDPERRRGQHLGQGLPGPVHPRRPDAGRSARHLRYPEDLFSVQAEVLSTYHMTDPQVFYNKEDVWDDPHGAVRQAKRSPWCPTT